MGIKDITVHYKVKEVMQEKGFTVEELIAKCRNIKYKDIEITKDTINMLVNNEPEAQNILFSVIIIIAIALKVDEQDLFEAIALP